MKIPPPDPAKLRGLHNLEDFIAYYDVDYDVHRCALGLLMLDDSICNTNTQDRLTNIIKQSVKHRRKIIIDVNDGIYRDYQQPTPKARILAFLRDVLEESRDVERLRYQPMPALFVL